jgi:hypothetical protein
LFQSLSTESGGESWTPIHGVVSGGAAFGASRISDSLRRSDDHPAAGDMPRTHQDRTQQKADPRKLLLLASSATSRLVGRDSRRRDGEDRTGKTPARQRCRALMRCPPENSGSHLTLWWREQDSNPWSLARGRTRANHVIHLSRWWNPAVEDQCNGRALRIGQTRPVTVHIPVATLSSHLRSFDQNLHALLDRKRRLLYKALLPPEVTESERQRLLDETLAGA